MVEIRAINENLNNPSIFSLSIDSRLIFEALFAIMALLRKKRGFHHEHNRKTFPETNTDNPFGQCVSGFRDAPSFSRIFRRLLVCAHLWPYRF
jgi:hypothetical protein